MANNNNDVNKNVQDDEKIKIEQEKAKLEEEKKKIEEEKKKLEEEKAKQEKAIKEAKKDITYIVTAPVEKFCGIVAGVHFAYGKAEVKAGWVLNWFIEKGYKVEEKK